VSEKTWEFAQRANVHSVVLSDAQAAMACVRLANEERIVVEPACGVSVAACYGQTLREVVPDFSEDSRVVIIVCGGEFTFFPFGKGREMWDGCCIGMSMVLS